MKMRKMISTCIFLLILMIPVTAFAVEFEISDVKINVYLQEDGNAEVVETYTYDFDSKFKGVTREVVPKQGASIIHFEAFEKGQPLKIEKEQDTYKIHRSGKKETVHVDIQYTIVNAIEKYEDGAQFYWPFFDKRNEADYGNMQITVYPPAKAQDIDYLGYDAAYQKGSIGNEGAVIFALGQVPAKTNGDIRVIYEPTLFSDQAEISGTIREQVKSEKTRLANELVKYKTTQKKMKSVGLYTVIGFALFIFGLGTYMFNKRRGTKRAAQSRIAEDFIPQERLSMPATIFYTNPTELGSEVISAALLDLIRKGYVNQVSEKSFELVDGSGANTHESALIELLFNKVGDGIQFSFDDLQVYTEEEKNHEAYSVGLHKWRTGIVQETKKAGLFEKRLGLRWTVGAMSVALIPIIVQLGRYEVFLFMAFMIMLVLIGLGIAFFYHPRNVEGFQLKQEWRRFRERFENVGLEEWEQIPVDDKYRAYIYGIGMKDGNLKRQFTAFAQAERRAGDSYVAYNPVFMTQNFTTAHTNAGIDASGTSSSGGVAGSGGGSGAF
ncbi:DUF2207 domain-containing protein [Sporosarcina ureilytica]|uniref:DUF2207 domain-containing protein n=1 Tax=Sporosarcina ureilytica TaxID=298596 RepID=A0A1D8JCZ6_9BACL|nr:DUF2207 domain-containing protein [Sporosarcina ureilytica]AOV06576.1 hypothetical protein BI350_02440 [Sporosarcina ureilytica]